MAILELNDWQLTLRGDDGGTVLSEPAAAALRGGELVFGSQALAQSRSQPQQFNQKYLSTLAAEPVSGNLGPARNQADLIYHHLRTLTLPTDQPLAIAVAGHLNNDQLGLLLGICQELGLVVSDFIDNALAYSLNTDVNGDYHVLDVELHRLVLTAISVTGQQRLVGSAKTFDGLGLVSIVEGWMNVVADEFVHKTRFDPTHAGATEQQVFDTIHGWLGRPEVPTQRIRVSFGEGTRELDVAPPLLIEKLRRRLAGADLSSVQTLVVTPRVNQIPFLADLLSGTVANLIQIEAAEAAHSFRQLASHTGPGGVRRISQADSQHDISSTGPTEQTGDRSAPATHLLADHIARPLHHPQSAALFDGNGRIVNGKDVLINGAPATGALLQPGDQVQFGGRRYLAIRME